MGDLKVALLESNPGSNPTQKFFFFKCDNARDTIRNTTLVKE